MKIAFIGGGNMASALIGGLRAAGDAHELAVADPSAEVRARLADRFGVRCHKQTATAVVGAEVIVLAVKPQVVDAALAGVGDSLTPEQTFVSVAAGTTIATLHARLAAGVPVVRTMPNTPALLGLGITGLFADGRCDASDRQAAELVMGACGETVWVAEEAQMNVVTAISGSGPAYFYLFTEALADAGSALGLPEETARRLARQTALGAGAMAGAGDVDVVELRRRVTSPGGTTQAAIESFEADALRAIVARAAAAAVRRGRELAEEGSTS